MEIKFIEGHSFVGEEMSVVVNGVQHALEWSPKQDYFDAAIKLLKEKYDIDMKHEDIKFEWNGTL